MGRNNPKNMKIHNDKLHKEKSQAKLKVVESKAKLKEIMDIYNAKKNQQNTDS